MLVAASPHAEHGVDTTEHFAQGVASLEAHAEYLRGLGEHAMADPREFLESFARQTGTRMGVKFGSRVRGDQLLSSGRWHTSIAVSSSALAWLRASSSSATAAGSSIGAVE